MEQNALSKNFKTGTLIKYALPTIAMMVFMSLYTTVDGIFVANLISEEALSAVNIILPVVSIIFAIGLMLSKVSPLSRHDFQKHHDTFFSFWAIPLPKAAPYTSLGY